MTLLPLKWTGYCIVLSIFSQGISATDLAKEARLKEQIVDYIMEGEAVMLTADSHRFLSIHMQPESGHAKGGVIIMHGRGYHPNWPELVYPLRTGLTDFGWHTLSIQMPVLDNEASFYDYLDIVPDSLPRIDAAVQYMKQQGLDNIALLAHSCSVHMSVAWLEQNQDQEITAYVGIGMGSTDIGQAMPSPFPLQKFTMPVLDLYGEMDYPSVKAKAPQRWQRIQQGGHPKSAQRVIPEADHYFTGKGQALLIEVSRWLDELN